MIDDRHEINMILKRSPNDFNIISKRSQHDQNYLKHDLKHCPDLQHDLKMILIFKMIPKPLPNEQNDLNMISE